MEELNWSDWRSMPDPENCRQIISPTGPGVYQIKNSQTNQYILFGESIECQKRMKSLYPKPYGVGTRNNEKKRLYVLNNWKVLKYRTVRVESKHDAVIIDKFLKSLNIHLFNT